MAKYAIVEVMNAECFLFALPQGAQTVDKIILMQLYTGIKKVLI
jgi:hypothetical protein